MANNCVNRSRESGQLLSQCVISRPGGEAQFKNGMIPGGIYINRGKEFESRGENEVIVVSVEKNAQLYPFYRGHLSNPMEGPEFWVLAMLVLGSAFGTGLAIVFGGGAALMDRAKPSK